MDLGLRDRVAIVTGSSRGIGRATAEALAAEGARVALNARGTETLEQTARELRNEGAEVLAVGADVMSVEGCDQLVRTTLEQWGKIDILVNNVGGGAAASVAEDDAAWQAAYDWTFWPSLRLSRLVAPHMQRQRRGAIVMVASIYGRERGGRAAYQVVKSAQISLAKALALELAP
ncbi:MAG: SDR family NAD(P)-dependent oxidoreductase, partial [Chloroflexi bacterium]|nr:SDR family NAD(P)-dependent oxidoreductase [Chloroflexota bacterium]